MKVIFSGHGKKQRVERKIPRKYILETANNPERIGHSFRDRKLHQREFGDKILEVVTILEEDNLIIITQYWLKKE